MLTCTRIWWYASFRSIFVIHSLGWRAAIIENRVSILNEGTIINWVSLSLVWDGRNHPASALGKGDCNSPATSGPLPPLWLGRDRASAQRVEGRLLCCCWVTPVDDGGVVEGRRRRLVIYLVKLSSLFRNVGEIVVSKFLWNGLASPQPEAGQSYFRPCPLPLPRPLLLKGRLEEGPLESFSCRRWPWSLESFLLETYETLGRSLV